MILASKVYQKVSDALLQEANGNLSFDLFNRYSELAELDLLDWLSGDIRGNNPPTPYTTQKDLDFLSTFIKKEKLIAGDGHITFPKDYYSFENMYMLGVYGRDNSECSGEEKEWNILDDSNTPIELLSGSQFTMRCNTFIDGLQPSFKKPIAKVVGKTFEFMPKDLGSIGLEYYRYPKFAQIKTTVDTQFNQQIVDESATDNYEWDDKAMPVLIWFIVNRFADRTSNKSMKEFNNSTGKTPKG